MIETNKPAAAGDTDGAKISERDTGEPAQRAPPRPVLTALEEAWRNRWELAFSLRWEDKTSAAARKFLRELSELLGEINELSDWLDPTPKPFSLEQALDHANMMRKVGIPSEYMEGVLQKVRRRRKGRPATNRRSVITALERKMLEPEARWTWLQLAQEFCGCGKSSHDTSCKENLRRQVFELIKVLRRYTSLGV